MAPASSVHIDESRWPLRLVRFTGTATPGQYARYLEDTTACLLRRERYVSITDLSQGGLPTAEQRRQQALWMRQHEALLREVLLGVSSVMYFKPMPVPYLVAARELDAVAWACSRLEDAGLHLDAGRCSTG